MQVRLVLIVTTIEALAPVQPVPLQPAKVELRVAVARSVTFVPLVNGALQVVAGQSMPAGVDATVPVPPPAKVMSSVCVPAGGSKVAVQVRLVLIVTTIEALAPVQPVPLQPAKVELRVAVARSVTFVPLANGALQVVAGQSMPAGVDATVPVPAPARLTIRVGVVAGGSKVAVQVRPVLIVTTIEAGSPVQPVPLQPAKVELRVAVARSVTFVPLVNGALQVVAGQSMPAGVDATVPVPVPARLTVRVGGGTKFAVQVRSAVMVTLGPQPVPLQFAKVEPPVAVGVSTTFAPLVNVSLQIPGQLMVPGFDVTVPVPPDIRMVRVRTASNVAVQPTAADIVTVPSAQSASPVQPAKVDVASGVAVSVTDVPTEYGSLQSPGHVIPAGLEVTVPDPVPAIVTASVFGGMRSNVAVQLRAALIVTLPSVQSASPLHPANVEPDAGAGMSVTRVPSSYNSVQSLPQLIPAGLVVIVPEPVPVFDTVRVKVASGFRSNVAVQVRAAFIVTWPSPQSASPLHPANIDPAVAVGVSVTTVPSA